MSVCDIRGNIVRATTDNASPVMHNSHCRSQAGLRQNMGALETGGNLPECRNLPDCETR